FRVAITFRDGQGCTQGDEQREFLPSTLGCIWQSSKQLQSFGEMRDRFRMGRALTRLLPGALPIGERLRTQPRLGVVVGHQAGPGQRYLSELRLQSLGNPMMIMLTRPPQQGRISRFLYQGMLEDVPGLDAHTPLVQ